MKLQRFAPVLLVAMTSARTAEAHFVLLAPATWTQENALGDPQKDEPCGGEGGTPTGAVTQLQAGETITLRWQETIYHPGHWRIALAADRNDLIDPVVTLDSNQVSTGAEIQDPPVAPVLLDNLFPRTSPSGSSGMMFEQDITLPMTPCARCTIQVIQFMLGHGPPNYIYHHCADIEIVGAPPPDAGAPDAMVDMDTGVAIDAGAPQDAATPFDGGQIFPDAASVPDGGASTGDDSGVTNSVGGGCTSFAASRRGDGIDYAFLLLFSLALLSRRRHGPSRSAS